MTETVKRYIRKPAPIFAVKLTRDNCLEVSLWCGGDLIEEAKSSDPTDVYIGIDVVVSTTIYQKKRAKVGDYIVKYVSGKFGILDASQFELSYEESPVDEPV